MREVDENTIQALRGSRTGDELVCWVWYDGALAYPDPLPISNWSMEWDGDSRQKVHGTINLTVNDPDGQLGPWLYDDPLGVGGSWLQVFYRVGGAGEIQMGKYRITSNSTKAAWSFRIIAEHGYIEPDSSLPAHQRYVAVPEGSSVTVSGSELTVDIDADEFLAPENPHLDSIHGEITRLVGDTMPVKFTDVPDGNVPDYVVYEENRLEAVQDLLSRVGATYRMTGDGVLECYRASSKPVAILAGGMDGVLIDIDHSQSIDQVYNIGVVTSTRKDTQIVDGEPREVDVPVVGRYQIQEGPFRVGGPLGRRVVRNDNPLMNSETMARKAAESLVLNRLSAQTIELGVSCLPNPTLQTGDFVTIEAPQPDGRLVPFNGEIVNISLSGSGSIVGEMGLTVRSLLADVADALKNYNIGSRLTDTRPEMTFNNGSPLRTLRHMNVESDKV